MATEEESDKNPPPDSDLVPSGLITTTSTQIREKAEDFSTLYANNMAVGFTQWDCHVIFGEIVGARDGKPLIEEFTKIIMTREAAKALTQLLVLNIKNYEEQFGEIEMPSKLLPSVESLEPAEQS